MSEELCDRFKKELIEKYFAKTVLFQRESCPLRVGLFLWYHMFDLYVNESEIGQICFGGKVSFDFRSPDDGLGG